MVTEIKTPKLNNPTSFRQAIAKTFISLRNRNFRLYFIGQLISSTGNWLTNVALTLLVLKLTQSGLAVGILAACQYGPILLLSAWGGAIADRSDKRLLLLLTQCLEMAQSIGLAILAFMPHPPIVWLYILAALGGIVLAFDNPVRRSFVSEMVTDEDVPNAIVLNSTIVNISRIFGPALAGLLVITVGYGWCFAIDAATYIAVIFCLYIMRPQELRRQAPKPKSKGEIREGIRYVISQPTLFINFIMLGVIGTLAYNFTVTLPLFVITTLHSNEGVFTILYSIFSFGAVVSGLVIAQRGLVKIRHVIFGAGALGFTMILFASVPGIPTAGVVIFFMGVASILYMTSTTAIVQVETKPEMLGRVLALQSILIIGTTPIGGPLSGFMADALGARSPIIFGGVICLITATFGYFANQNYKNNITSSGLNLKN